MRRAFQALAEGSNANCPALSTACWQMTIIAKAREKEKNENWLSGSKTSIGSTIPAP